MISYKTCLFRNLITFVLLNSLIVPPTFAAPTEGKAFLTTIINQWKGGKVTIKSSDQNAGTIVVKGSHFSNKQDTFSLADVSSLNYFIPEDPNAITITVYDAQDNAVSSATLQSFPNPSSGHVRNVELANPSGYNDDPKKTRGLSWMSITTVPGEKIDIGLQITDKGVIRLPVLLTIRFTNNTGAPLQVAVPECSLDQSVHNMIRSIPNDPNIKHTVTIIGDTQNSKAICKFVATTTAPSSRAIPTGSQATMCITKNSFKSLEADNCPNCSETSSGIYKCCDTDPFTGESVCTNEGIVWVRGQSLRMHGGLVLMEYGITQR